MRESEFALEHGATLGEAIEVADREPVQPLARSDGTLPKLVLERSGLVAISEPTGIERRASPRSSMQIHFLCRGIPDATGLLAHVERRAAFSFDRFTNRIRRLWVRLRDDNGPRCGIDKRCSLVVEMVRGPRLCFVAESVDPKAAVDRALDRAAHALARTSDRRRALGNRMSAGGTEL